MEHPVLFRLICFRDSVFPKTAPTWRRSQSRTERGWECQLPRERQLHLCLAQLLMAPEKRGQDLWPPGALGNPYNRIACSSLQHKCSWVRDLWVKIKEQMAKESIFTNVESVLCLYAHTLSCMRPTCTPLLMDNEFMLPAPSAANNQQLFMFSSLPPSTMWMFIVNVKPQKRKFCRELPNQVSGWKIVLCWLSTHW